MKCTLMGRARSMLISANLDKYFWEKIVGIDFYFINRSPSRTLVDKTLYEMWLGK